MGKDNITDKLSIEDSLDNHANRFSEEKSKQSDSEDMCENPTQYIQNLISSIDKTLENDISQFSTEEIDKLIKARKVLIDARESGVNDIRNWLIANRIISILWDVLSGM